MPIKLTSDEEKRIVKNKLIVPASHDDITKGNQKTKLVNLEGNSLGITDNALDVYVKSGVLTVQPGNTQNTTAWLVKELRSATPTITSVADIATSTTLLALNTNRLGASFHNTSSAILYLKCGATATVTKFTVRMVQYAYYELPYQYTGIVDGIWASDPNDGSCLITEFT